MKRVKQWLHARPFWWGFTLGAVFGQVVTFIIKWILRLYGN
jgi:hypothetical protein